MASTASSSCDPFFERRAVRYPQTALVKAYDKKKDLSINHSRITAFGRRLLWANQVGCTTHFVSRFGFTRPLTAH